MKLGKVMLILNVCSVETPRYLAKSLAEPPEACQPQEGLKYRSAQAPGSTWQGQLGTHPTGRPSFMTQNLGEVFRASEGDDGAVGRSGDLTKATTEPKGGLAT
jgi:hypothetical protein